MTVKYFIAYGIKNDENGIVFHLKITKIVNAKTLFTARQPYAKYDPPRGSHAYYDYGWFTGERA